MLKFEDFTVPQNSLTCFKFQQLKMTSSSISMQSITSPIYSDPEGNTISYIQVDTLEQVKVFDSLALNGVLLNYKGVLGKENKQGKNSKYYLFYGVDGIEDQAQFSNDSIIRNQTPDQRFCIEYFQSFSIVLSEFQKHAIYPKVFTPNSIGLRNSRSKTKVGFGLLLPFACKYFNCILKQQYQQNIKYIAPEVIRYFTTNINQQLCQKQFRKAGLYSLGLTLLSCFGYTFTTKQRLEAARNGKEFRNIFKKIRKQIKLLHAGKFVPKVLKLLLQDCQKSRQTLQTFVIKLRSAQFESLKVCKNVNVNEYRYYSTLCQSNKSQIMKSQKNITIQINGYNTSPLNLTPISNGGYVDKTDKSRGQEMINSPLHIEVSFQDETPKQSMRYKAQERLNQQYVQEDQNQKKQTNVEQNMMISSTRGQAQRADNFEPKMQPQDGQIYSYNVNELKIGQSYINDKPLGQDSIFMDPDIIVNNNPQQNYDERTVLRKKFENQSKVILAVILIGFFAYGLVGYMRQAMAT